MAGITSVKYLLFNRAIGMSLIHSIQLIEGLLAAPADANFFAVRQNLVADPHRRITLVAHDHNVRSMNARFLLDDAAGLLWTARLCMALDHVSSFNDDSVFIQ